MGYAEALTYLPSSHAHYAPLLARHHRHLKRMLELQQPDGSWLQLLDYPVRGCCAAAGTSRNPPVARFEDPQIYLLSLPRHAREKTPRQGNSMRFILRNSMRAVLSLCVARPPPRAPIMKCQRPV
jgi:hypothetical protein